MTGIPMINVSGASRPVRLAPTAVLIGFLRAALRSRKKGTSSRYLALQPHVIEELKRRNAQHWTMSVFGAYPCPCGKPATRVVGRDAYCVDCARLPFKERRAALERRSDIVSVELGRAKRDRDYRDLGTASLRRSAVRRRGTGGR